jgi:hypothetical protein
MFQSTSRTIDAFRPLAIWAGALVTELAIVVSGLLAPRYSIANLGIHVLLVMSEAAVLHVVLCLRTYRRSWGRALVAAGFGFAALWFAAQDTIGAPTYVFIHQGWLVAAIIACLVLALKEISARVRERYAA